VAAGEELHVAPELLALGVGPHGGGADFGFHDEVSDEETEEYADGEKCYFHDVVGVIWGLPLFGGAKLGVCFFL
jgi:hypothetical protein